MNRSVVYLCTNMTRTPRCGIRPFFQSSAKNQLVKRAFSSLSRVSLKPCQGLFIVFIICYHNIFVKYLWYITYMPRPRKQPLPIIESSSDAIGHRLAKIRKSKGLTQIQLAEKIGINQYQISDYETGRLHLADEMIIRMAKALSTSSDSILGLNESSLETPSLKLVKRLQKIENLPQNEQKALLKNIDMYLKAAASES